MIKPNKKEIAKSIFRENKELIKNVADSEQLNTGDKPMRRQALNDLLDSLLRDIRYFVLTERITEAQSRSIEERLTNYVIKRHDKWEHKTNHFL